MSKMDALRAMREARYEAARAAKPVTAKTPGTSPTKPAAKAPAKTPAKTPVKAATSTPADDAAPVAEERLCGHKNMGGRTCTREHGHTAKSHRYS